MKPYEQLEKNLADLDQYGRRVYFEITGAAKECWRLLEGLEKMLQNRGTMISRPTQPSGLDRRL